MKIGHGSTKSFSKNNELFCKDKNVFHMMQAVLIHLFGYGIFPSRELTFDELKVIVRECQLLMLLVVQHIHSETQKNVIGVFSSTECDETLHIIDGTYSKCITIPFISGAFDWCCDDGSKFLHAHEG